MRKIIIIAVELEARTNRICSKVLIESHHIVENPLRKFIYIVPCNPYFDVPFFYYQNALSF